MFVTIILYILTSSLLFYVFFKWATKNHDYFAKRGVKHLKPNFLIGNTLGYYLSRFPSHIFLQQICSSYPKEKLIGFFNFLQPIYMACDAEIITQIGITKFDHFVNRDSIFGVEADKMFSKALMLLSDDRWRAMRSKLTPVFTCNKLRNMFNCFVSEAAHNFTNSLIVESQQNGSVRCKMEQFFERYIATNIASCAFGLQINSLENPSDDFFVYSKFTAYITGVKAGLRLMLCGIFPKLMHAIGVEVVPHRIKTFFKRMALDTMNERTKNQIVRPDVTNALMTLRNERLEYERKTTNTEDISMTAGDDDDNRQWTDDVLVAQFFFIFLASIDSPTYTMAFMAYELALNQDVQQKLYEEIRTVNDTLDGNRLTFDGLSKLKYLDQVMHETLRKWIPGTFTTRQCTKDVELDLGDGKKVNIERGMSIWIPISAVHNNNFESPLKFDPERFNEQNKAKIKAGTYIPFGIGPRQCFGNQFALMGIKILFFNLMLQFSFEPYEATQIPLKIAKGVGFCRSEKEIHLELKRRTQN